MTEDPHATLVQRATRGDTIAVEELLVRHLPSLRAYVRLHSDPLLREHESCSDLAQSVCREVLGELHGFEYQDEPAFRAWLYQKALSKILDRRRYWLAQRRDPAREESQQEAFLAAFCSPSQMAIGREAMERLERCFDRLPDDYRRVITLAKLIGRSHAEIAAEMHREEGAVRVLLHRALVRLAKLYNE